jgi:hypothetical protein
MKHKLILIGGVIASAVVSIAIWWGVYTVLAWMMEAA